MRSVLEQLYSIRKEYDENRLDEVSTEIIEQPEKPKLNITLRQAIEQNMGTVAKIGSHISFIYADTIDDGTIRFIKGEDRNLRVGNVPLLDRKVEDIYDSVYGGIVIIFEGKEAGRYWTVEEFREAKQKREMLQRVTGRTKVNVRYTKADQKVS